VTSEKEEWFFFLFFSVEEDLLHSVFDRETRCIRFKSVRVIMSGNSSKTGAIAKKGQVVRERALPGPKVSNTTYPKRNNEQHSSAAMLVVEKGKKPAGLSNSKTLELSRLSFFLMLQVCLFVCMILASKIYPGDFTSKERPTQHCCKLNLNYNYSNYI